MAFFGGCWSMTVVGGDSESGFLFVQGEKMKSQINAVFLSPLCDYWLVQVRSVLFVWFVTGGGGRGALYFFRRQSRRGKVQKYLLSFALDRRYLIRTISWSICVEMRCWRFLSHVCLVLCCPDNSSVQYGGVSTGRLSLMQVAFCYPRRSKLPK